MPRFPDPGLSNPVDVEDIGAQAGGRPHLRGIREGLGPPRMAISRSGSFSSISAMTFCKAQAVADYARDYARSEVPGQKNLPAIVPLPLRITKSPAARVRGISRSRR
jgi:hypothetical protein